MSERSREYRSWQMMKTRCYNLKASDYNNYGGRGIKVCARWNHKHGFKTFLADLGPRPPNTTLDRIDNAKHYTPSNCRWATVTEQNRRRRNVKLTLAKANTIRRLVAAGVRYKEIARRYGIAESRVTLIKQNKIWRNNHG